MLIKVFNRYVLIATQTTQIILAVYFGALFAQILWYLSSPNDTIYMEHIDTTKFENNVKFIINHHVFGNIVQKISTNQSQSSIVNTVKLTGIYFSTIYNSFAIMEMDNQAYVVQVGSVLSNAVVDRIYSDKVSMNTSGTLTDIPLTAGAAARPNNNFVNTHNSNNMFIDIGATGSSNQGNVDYGLHKKLIEEYEFMLNKGKSMNKSASAAL
jgi:hypothetical protein